MFSWSTGHWQDVGKYIHFSWSPRTQALQVESAYETIGAFSEKNKSLYKIQIINLSQL